MTDSPPAKARGSRASRTRQRGERTPVWDAITFLPSALPNLTSGEIDTSVRLLDHDLALPLLLDTPLSGVMPPPLLAIAERHQIPINLGDLLPVLRDPSQGDRSSVSPPGSEHGTLRLGEIGLRDLLALGRQGELDGEQTRALLDEIGVGALIIRLDFVEAALSGEADLDATGGFSAIVETIRQVRLPVLVRSQAGISRREARSLIERGLAGLIIGGAEVLGERQAGPDQASMNDAIPAVMASAFPGWGIPTVAAIRMLRSVGAPVISDGRVESGLDAAKAIALGADLVTLTPPKVTEQDDLVHQVEQMLGSFRVQLRTVMFLTGATKLAGLKQVPFVATGQTREWLEAAETLWRGGSLGD